MKSNWKVRAGISFDPLLVDILDEHTRRLSGLAVDRSEIVNAILSEYFEDNGTSEAVWAAISKRRFKRKE